MVALFRRLPRSERNYHRFKFDGLSDDWLRWFHLEVFVMVANANRVHSQGVNESYRRWYRRDGYSSEYDELLTDSK